MWSSSLVAHLIPHMTHAPFWLPQKHWFGWMSRLDTWKYTEYEKSERVKKQRKVNKKALDNQFLSLLLVAEDLASLFQFWNCESVKMWSESHALVFTVTRSQCSLGDFGSMLQTVPFTTIAKTSNKGRSFRGTSFIASVQLQRFVKMMPSGYSPEWHEASKAFQTWSTLEMQKSQLSAIKSMCMSVWSISLLLCHQCVLLLSYFSSQI